jgi:hypothetical protein
MQSNMRIYIYIYIYMELWWDSRPLNHLHNRNLKNHIHDKNDDKA